MLRIPIILILFAGLLFGVSRLFIWDMRANCEARWHDVGETHWSRRAQCMVKIDGVFVPEDSVIFNPSDAHRRED